MNLTIYQKLLSAYGLALMIYWVILSGTDLQTDFWNYFYSFSFSLIPLFGGILGLSLSKPWGFLDSAIGRAIFYISAGSLSWGLGSMFWSYYNFFMNDPMPYPSLADVGFVLALPFWCLGIFNLSKATGAKFGLKYIKGRIFFGIVPLLIVGFSYYFLVVVARGGVLTQAFNDYTKLFFDLAYPLGDVIILTLAVVIFGLSFKYFGGVYRYSIYALLMGFAVMYAADFIFSYTTTNETFYNGNFGDLVFTVALFLITFGVFGFVPSTTDNEG